MKTSHKVISFFFASLLIMLSLAMCGQEKPAADHLRQGNELSRSGKFEEAVAEYEQALEIEPENVDLLSNLGVAYYNLGNLDKATDHWSKAIEIAPNDADIRSNLAAAYVQLDQLDSALEEYKKAVELKPTLTQAFFGLGVVYALLGRKDDAIQAFEEFQELDTGEDLQATSDAEEYLKLLRGQ